MDIMLKVEKIGAHGQFTEKYRNTVYVPDDIQPPFAKLLDGLALLYPNCVYTFQILNFQTKI